MYSPIFSNQVNICLDLRVLHNFVNNPYSYYHCNSNIDSFAPLLIDRCHSSIKAMEMFIQFANEYSHQVMACFVSIWFLLAFY